MAAREVFVVASLLAAACHRPLHTSDDGGAIVSPGSGGAPAAGAGGAAGHGGSGTAAGTAGGGGGIDGGEMGGVSGTRGEMGGVSGTRGEMGGASGTGGGAGGEGGGGGSCPSGLCPDGGIGVPCLSNDGRSRECAPNLFCEIPVNACYNDAPSPGICAGHPGGCDAVYQPVCGCDGKLYGNDCERMNAGVAKGLIQNCNPADCQPAGAGGGTVSCLHPGEICRYAIGSGCTEQRTCRSNVWLYNVTCP